VLFNIYKWICYVILNSVIYYYYLCTGMAWNYILVTFKSQNILYCLMSGLWWVVFATCSNVCSWNSLCMSLNSWQWQKFYVYGLKSDDMSICMRLICFAYLDYMGDKEDHDQAVWNPSLYINNDVTALLT
jgi:hypothetical protein